MINDAFEGFTNVLRDRLRNQLLGAFILFWLTFNWKIPILIFKSAQPIEATIQVIDSQHLSISRSLVLPLSFAIAYVSVSPWLAHLIFLYQGIVDKLRIRAKQAQELFVLDGKAKLMEREGELELKKRNVLAVFENNQKEAEWNQKLVHEEHERRQLREEKWRDLDSDYQLKERRMKKDEELRKKYPGTSIGDDDSPDPEQRPDSSKRRSP